MKTKSVLSEIVKNLLKETFETYRAPNGLIGITVKTLQQIAPEAASSEPDEDAFELGLWVIMEKPQPKDPDDDMSDYTETNEPEFGEMLNAEWDEHAVNVDGEKFVILCGSWDDEYGYFWSDAAKTWNSYMF